MHFDHILIDHRELMMLTYTDLIQFDTYEDRLAYLLLDVPSSEVTFAELRELNQTFYQSPSWKNIRRAVIARDYGYDLGVPGHDIYGRVIVHHMNPVRPSDLYLQHEIVLDPENLITVSHETHLKIHFGFERPSGLPDPFSERKPGDTRLW